jgi:adenylate cyclase
MDSQPASSDRRLIAIMFTDIVGYSAIMGRDESEALQLLTTSRELQSTIVSEFSGEWLKEMGDGTLVSFTSAYQAVCCAIKIQQTAFEGALRNKLRIGLHIGDVTTDNHDVFGDGVNIASRIQAIADPGGIYISEDVYHMINSHADIRVKHLGKVSFKNIKGTINVDAIEAKNLPEARIIPGVKWTIPAIIFTTLLVLSLAYPLLKSFGIIGGSPQINSITVLPFSSLNEDTVAQDYFTVGMTHTLINNLAKVSALKVIWSGSTPYQPVMASITDVGRQLKADAVVVGTVWRNQHQIRISAQLIDAYTDEILWSESYDRELENILQIHSEVAQAIVSSIEVVVTPLEMAELSDAQIVNAQGYDALLKGYYHLYKLHMANYDSALRYFNMAKQYPELAAEAQAGIALVWVHLGQWGGEAPLVTGVKASLAAKQAVALNPALPMANQAMAHVYTSYLWEWDSGELSFEKAIKLNPNLIEARLLYADLLVSLHKNPEAIEQIDIANALDPTNAFSNCLKGWVLYANIRFDEAEVAFKTSLEDDPNLPLTHRCMWGIYHFKGDYKLAIHHAALFYENQNLPEIANILRKVYAEFDYPTALKEAEAALIDFKTNHYVSSMRVARLATFRGNNEGALFWLDEAYKEHYVSFFSLNVDPHWQALHSEPKFIELVDRLNLTMK